MAHGVWPLAPLLIGALGADAGILHFSHNPNCAPAQFLANFGERDPGARVRVSFRVRVTADLCLSPLRPLTSTLAYMPCTLGIHGLSSSSFARLIVSIGCVAV